METLQPQNKQPLANNSFNKERARAFVDRKHHDLARKQKLARRFLPLMLVAAGTAAFAGNQVANHVKESNTISNAYYADIQPGGTAIGAVHEIEKEHHIDLPAVIVGQDASRAESEDLGKSYVAQPGDTVVVYTNKDDGYVSSEIITSEERFANM